MTSVTKNGKDWALISSLVGRPPMECRDRWYKLSGEVNNEAWTAEVTTYGLCVIFD